MIHPYSTADTSVDYTREPITITGYVNYPEARVTVNGIEAKVTQDGNYSAKIQLKEGSTGARAIATLGQKTDEIGYSVMVTANGKMAPIPGLGSGGTIYSYKVGLNSPMGFRFNSPMWYSPIELRAGEKKSVDLMLEAGKIIESPGQFTCTFTPVVEETSEIKLSMPEGIQIFMKPKQFTAWPNAIYHAEVIIEATSQVMSGEYRFSIEHRLEDQGRGAGEFIISVIP